MFATEGKVYLHMKDCQSKKGRPQADDLIIGQNLRNFREFKGLTQQEMGAKAGISFQQIQKYEKGSNRISASRLLQFSKILNVQMDLFFGPLYNIDNNDFHKLDPEIRKLVSILSEIEDKALLKQVCGVLRSISKVKDKF